MDDNGALKNKFSITHQHEAGRIGQSVTPVRLVAEKHGLQCHRCDIVFPFLFFFFPCFLCQALKTIATFFVMQGRIHTYKSS